MDFVRLAEQVLGSQLQLFDYENEYICLVNTRTVFKVSKHFYDGIFMGFNVYADGALVETYNTKQEANSVVDSIKEGLRLGVTYFRVPGN